MSHRHKTFRNGCHLLTTKHMNALLYSLVDLKKNKTARRDASYTVLYNTVCSTVNKHNTVSLSPACTCRASAIAITAPAVRTARESPCINHVQTLVVSVECTVVPSVCVRCRERLQCTVGYYSDRTSTNTHPSTHHPELDHIHCTGLDQIYCT